MTDAFRSQRTYRPTQKMRMVSFYCSHRLRLLAARSTMGTSSVLPRTAIVVLSFFSYYLIGMLVATYSIYATTKLCNSIKMQSDWSLLVQGAGTTRCIALYQTISRERVWLHETNVCFGRLELEGRVAPMWNPCWRPCRM